MRPCYPAGLGAREKRTKYTMAGTTVTTVKKGKGGQTVTTTKTTKSGNAGRKRSKGKRPTTMSKDNAVLSQHWQMLSDPCHATLTESAYRGRAGIPARFTGIYSYTTGTETAFALVANPASGAGTLTALANSATAWTPAYATALPGQAYLLTVADSARVIGACLDIDFVGTELQRAGMFYGGVLPLTTLPAAVATSVDNVKVLLNNETRVPDHQVDQLWFPGVGNEAYTPLGSASASYTADHNALVFLAENLPAGLQLRLRLTIIYEWVPKSGTGLITPTSMAGTNPPAAYEHLHAAAVSSPSFTESFTAGVKARATHYASRAGEAIIDASVAYVGQNLRRGPPRGRTIGM